MAVCEGCGTKNKRRAQFCTECGRILSTTQDTHGTGGADIFGAAFGGQTQDRPDQSAKRTGPANSRKKTDPEPVETGQTAPRDGPVATEKENHSGKTMTKAEAFKLVATTAVKAAAKSLTISTIVLGPGFYLLFSGQSIAGMIWLFLGSFGLMAWTYRKPWRVGWISVLIPPLVAMFSYAIQLSLFGSVLPPILLLLLTILVGLGFGYFRAQSHILTPDSSGSVIAERTIGFLVVWIASYAATQMLALLASNILLVRAGLLTGAFTTAALVALSWLLLTRSQRLRRATIGIFAALVATLALVERAEAQTSICWIELPKEIWVYTGPAVVSPTIRRGPGATMLARFPAGRFS